MPFVDCQQLDLECETRTGMLIRPHPWTTTMNIDSESALRIRRTESLTSIIRRELERMIARGELKAGERLNENALAAKLGVSRGPIRADSRARGPSAREDEG